MSEAMAKNLKDYRTALNRIRADRDLSEEAKARMMGEIHAAATEEHRRIIEDGRDRAAKSYDDAARSVFGLSLPSGTPGAERAAAQTSQRDAFFRVSGIDDGEELKRLSGMAAATGDRLLQRAILYRGGLELADGGVVEAVTQAEPEIGRAWESLKAAGDELRAAGSDPFTAAMYTPPKPEDMPTNSPAEAG